MHRVEQDILCIMHLLIHGSMETRYGFGCRVCISSHNLLSVNDNYFPSVVTMYVAWRVNVRKHLQPSLKEVEILKAGGNHISVLKIYAKLPMLPSYRGANTMGIRWKVRAIPDLPPPMSCMGLVLSAVKTL
jgi:hypothetical protein